MASLIVMAFNVNANSMIVNAMDFGLYQKKKQMIFPIGLVVIETVII